MARVYSVFWSRFKIVPRGDGETVKTVREVRTRLTLQEKDALLQQLTAEKFLASVSSYDDGVKS